jgi:methyl-accepting chemotaxis protein
MLTLTALGLVVFIMAVSTLIVSYTVKKQNMMVSTDSLKNAITIIQYQLAGLEKKIIADARQLVVSANLASELSLIESYQQRPDYHSMTKFNQVVMIGKLYATASAGNMSHIAVYNSKGNLLAFVKIEKDHAFGAFPYKKEDKPVFLVARVKPGDEIGENLFEIVDQWPFGMDLLTTGVTEESQTFYKSDKTAIQITAVTPAIEEKFHFKTKKKERRVLGMVTAATTIGQNFSKQVAMFSGTEVMVFSSKGSRAGTLTGYNNFSFDEIKKIDKRIKVGKVQIFLDEIKISGQGYARAIYPLTLGQMKIGVLAVLHSKAIADANTKQIISFLSVAALVCLLLLLPVVFFFAGTMTKPIQKVVNSLENIAQGEGDLTMKLDVKSKNEIGELSQWFNLFIEKLRGIVSDIKDNASSLDASSGELSTTSKQSADTADEMSAKFNGVAASTVEMSDNLSSIAAAMEEASTNVNMVVSATDQMTETVGEISVNSSKARQIAQDAVTMAGQASDGVKELGQTADQIGNFVESITEISNQTNLLALNATIEAARAGEAGKGFAVVANEIKDLAKQTAEAALEIKEKIVRNQESTQKTIGQINSVTQVVTDINDIISTIAAAVEEQSATTQEISDNITQMSQGIQEVNKNVTHSSDTAIKIVADINLVNNNAGKLSASSGNASNSAEKLAQLAANLQQLVSVFKT